MPKVGRNQKCPCGSGHKYKNCCEKKVLKNTFRDTVNISPEEGLKRDSFLLYLHLKFREQMLEADRAHTQSLVLNLRDHKNLIAKQPECESRTAVLEDLDKQITLTQQASDRSKLTGFEKVALGCLREKFEKAEADPDEIDTELEPREVSVLAGVDDSDDEFGADLPETDE